MRSVDMAHRCYRVGLAIAGLLILVAVRSFAQPKVEVVPQAPKPQPTVSVVGVASTEVRPDTAILSFGVEIRDPNTSQAVSVNQRMTKKVVGAIEHAGVATADISVTPYQMEHVANTFIPALGTNQPVEFRIQQKGTYKVTSNITVTLHSVTDVAEITDAALNAGVDRIGAIRYESSRRNQIENSLVPKALADARRAAEALGRSAGLQIGTPLTVSMVPSGPTSLAVLPAKQGPNGTATSPLLRVTVKVRVVYSVTKENG